MTEFQRALARVLAHEGGYVNHPADPGGATNKGVTQAVYDAWRRQSGRPTQTVRNITPGEIELIYRAQYWDRIRGDVLPSGVSYVVFDGAVNSGVAQSVKWLQRALGKYYTGMIDGVIGNGTLDAVARFPDKVALIKSICAQRMAFLRALKTWPVFGKGWTVRVNNVCAVGQALASGAVSAIGVAVPEADEEEAVSARALPGDMKSAPATSVADASTGGGIVAVTLTQAIGQLTPLAGAPGVANLILWLTVVGVVVTVAGAVYSFWAKRRAEHLRSVQ